MTDSTSLDMGKTLQDINAIAAVVAGADAMARTGAAANPNTPPDMLRVLAHDQADGVRMQALLNPNCPDVTEETLRDAAERVSQRLEKPEHQEEVRRLFEWAIARINGQGA